MKLEARILAAATGVAAALLVRAGDVVVYEGAPLTWTTNTLVFKGPWNLASNGTLSVTLENLSKTDEVRLAVGLGDKTDERYRTTMIPAGFKGAIDVDVYPKIEHPEVAAKLKLMQQTPFGAPQMKYDPEHVPEINFVHYRHGPTTAPNGGMPTVVVSRVVAKDTSTRVWPACCRMTEKEFFPFIDRYGQYRFKDWPRKVKSDADLKANAEAERADLAAHPGPGAWDEYGGWAKGPKLKATGRFRFEKVDGKWWFVDPKGYLWWSHGVVRVTPSSAVTPLDGREEYFEGLPVEKDSKRTTAREGDDPFVQFYYTYDELLKSYYDKQGWKRTYDFSAANLLRKYGADWRAAYGDISHRRLRSWGLNTIANSSAKAIRTMNRTPWVERIETRGPKCKEQKGEGWWHVPDPYHPEFRRYLREQLETRRAEFTSPWCVGVFVDNEHDWRGISDKTVREYFKVIREEVKRLDPNLLYFGCRFAGYANERLVRLCAEQSDAISYNIYGFRIDALKLPSGVDKPILLGEFHFGSTSDTGLFNPSLVQVANQKERAKAYKRYVMDALKHPNIVGAHWHQFSDQPTTGRFDGEDFNVGFTDVCDTPYPEMREALREMGADLYNVRSGTPTFADEFDGAKLDESVWIDWVPSFQGRSAGFLFARDNVAVSNGCLNLTARFMREDEKTVENLRRGFTTYATAYVRRKEKSFYGYYECRAKTMHACVCNAFWLYDPLSDQPKKKFRPGDFSEEIDIFEIFGKEGTLKYPNVDRICFETVHRMVTPYLEGMVSGGVVKLPNRTKSAKIDYAPWADFHVYGFRWTEHELIWYIDGKETFRRVNDVYHRPLHLVFDCEIMYNWTGEPAPSDLPAVFSVDYFRYWKE